MTNGYTLQDLKDIGGIWYLSTPYTLWPDGLDDAAAMASVVASKLVKQQLPVFVPITMFHAIALGGQIDPLDVNIWLPACRDFVNICVGMLIADLPGWQRSKGIAQETHWFVEQGKRIFLLKDDLGVVKLR